MNSFGNYDNSLDVLSYVCSKELNKFMSVRRCHFCFKSKTPQWRSGPQGRLTLCNACGIKYGRKNIIK